jgi:1,4-alpha-glucan branching enzyme
MNDEFDTHGPLDQAIDLLRQNVPIVPGLEDRARRRQARRRRMHVVGASSMVTIAAFLVVMFDRTSDTPVTFALIAPSVRSVSVVGDFNNWGRDRTRLSRNAAGEWHGTVRLPPGQYRYAYLVDHDQWRADAREPSAPDDFGRPTSVVTVMGN